MPWQNSSQIYNDLIDIIDAVRRYIATVRLSYNHQNPFWTKTIYQGFDNEGRKLSFAVRHQNSGGGYLWDLCWISGNRSADSDSFRCSELELVLECEWATADANIRKKVLEDFFKIVDARAFMKVMVFVFSDRTPRASWTELTGTMLDISKCSSQKLDPAEVYALVGFPTVRGLQGQLAEPHMKTCFIHQGILIPHP